jgi:holliday junction DNA helicase RuvA
VIASLRGFLVDRNENSVVIECAGVGYEVLATKAALAHMPANYLAEARVDIHSHWTEDGPQLFGFLDTTERLVFRRILSVPGCGPKKAMALLNGLPVADILLAVRYADAAKLMVKGVGRKSAEQIVLALRDELLSAA